MLACRAKPEQPILRFSLHHNQNYGHPVRAPFSVWGETLLVDAASAKIAYVSHADRMNILLAEDNSDDVVLLEHAFKKAGVTSHLTAVTDGLEALDYLEGEGAFANRAAYPFPDVLLLDLNMPRKNGFEVLAWVRRDANCSRLMVHVLTASPRESDAER